MSKQTSEECLSKKCRECKQEFTPCIGFEEKTDLVIIEKYLCLRFNRSDFQLSHNEKNYYCYEHYTQNTNNFKKFLDDKEDEKINTRFEIDGITATGKGWKVYLSEQPSFDFLKNFIEEKNGVKAFKVKHFHRSLTIHRGHLLADSFDKYLVPKGNEKDSKVTAFFGKGNIDNINYQTKEANCSEEECYGQLHFEQKILNFFTRKSKRLTASDKGIIYLVEEIFKEGKSLGRLLLSYGEDPDIQFFVFIPNIFPK